MVVSKGCCVQMMKQLINLVFSCTDREALNLAIFLNETFILLERWRVRSAHALHI